LDCQKDDKLTFATNGIYISDPGTIKCDPDETTKTGTWSLSKDGKTLLLFGSQSSIVEITENKLVLKFVSDPNTILMTFIPW